MKPVLYDLCCCAGGATRGYQEAGFYVVGVDINPQPHYIGDEFILADALEVDLSRAHAIHASPPCQLYSAANNIHQRDDHPDLIPPMRARLKAAGVPWIMENVPRSPLENYTILCGLTFGLNVKRHRWFESDIALMAPPCPPGHPGEWVSIFGHTVLERSPQVGRTPNNGPIFRRKHLGTDVGRAAMGIDWMTRDELSEAIPPAYTSHLGAFLLDHVKAAA